MIVCFDTSALNQLMDDPDGNRLTSILLRDFNVYITALNIVEIGKTARVDRREQLQAFEKHLANEFEPLDLPNQLVQRAPRTHIVRWSKFRASLSGRGA
jgi:hypothetical protein